MKKIQSFEVTNKKVILRCDLNVSIKNDQILSDERIIASLETINYLIKHHAKVIIMSHLGKIKSEDDKKNNSLYTVYKRLCELLKTKVLFSSATRGPILENKINSLLPGEVLLMENTRYEDLNNSAESKCNVELSKYWAGLGEIFINDAFGMTHRKHASNYGISKYLTSGIGFLIEKELDGLERIIKPKHLFVVIMGGAKLEDKVALIRNILPKCDYLLLGGAIANTFLSIKNNVGKSLVSEVSDDLKELLTLYKERIIMPTDVLVQEENNITTKKVNEITDDDVIYDIGKETILNYEKLIKEAETVFLNGTMGKYEEAEFEYGTREILAYLSKLDIVKVIGGGDALSSADYFHISDFTFKSTGGGATLDYIASGKLRCFVD